MAQDRFRQVCSIPFCARPNRRIRNTFEITTNVNYAFPGLSLFSPGWVSANMANHCFVQPHGRNSEFVGDGIRKDFEITTAATFEYSSIILTLTGQGCVDTVDRIRSHGDTSDLRDSQKFRDHCCHRIRTCWITLTMSRLRF